MGQTASKGAAASLLQRELGKQLHTFDTQFVQKLYAIRSLH